MRIHQISPSISYGDATSNHIYEIDARLRQWGHESRIFVQFPPNTTHAENSVLLI